MGVLKPEARRASGLSTEGRLIYAIGDIHGNLDLLEALLIGVTEDALQSRTAVRPMLIFIGDYLDRGCDSAGVIDLIVSLRERDVFEVRPLKGNHEEAILTFLSDPQFGPVWSRFGGAETLSSYGVQPPVETAEPSAWVVARDALAEAMPPAHLDFLQSLELLIVVGDYAFAHAGVDPTAAMDRQVENDLLWIKDDFLRARRRTAKIVVHGHTPAEEPQILPHRLGIDTGAYASGVLTALRLHEGARGILQAGRTPELRSTVQAPR